jgi:hypothetical protein
MSEITSALLSLSAARRATSKEAELFALRNAGEGLAEALRRGPSVSLSTLHLSRLVLERAVALPALRAPVSFLTLERRAWRVESGDGVMLIDPATEDAFASTPFGQRFLERHPLRKNGIGGGELGRVGKAEVRRIVLSTLRYQSLRSLLTQFPRAVVEVHPGEHARYLEPSVSERAAYERNPLAEHERVVLLGERELAPGLLMIDTPGLGGGSMSAVANERGRIRVLSPHGVALDCWSPYESQLPGLRETLRLREIEAVTRGDADPVASSLSMGLERVIADRRADAPAFLDITPTFELVPSFFSPLAPTLATQR